MCQQAEYKATVLALVPSLRYLDYVQIASADVTAAVDQMVRSVANMYDKYLGSACVLPCRACVQSMCC